jgi:hypothetical protein
MFIIPMSQSILLFAAVALGGLGVASGGTYSLLQSGLDSKLYVAHVDQDNSTLMGPLAADGETTSDPRRLESATNPAAPWFLAQWSNPDPIRGEIDHPIPADCEADAVWGVATSSSRVCALPNGTYSVGSQGAGLACGVEFDMFLSPIGSANSAYQPPTFVVDRRRFNLQALRSVRCDFDMALVYSAVTERCGSSPSQCSASPDYSYLTLGLTLSNPIAGQTIFFQVPLWDTRWSSCGSGDDPCTPGPVNGTWYFSTLPTLGVNFHMGYYPASYGTCFTAANGTTQPFRFQNLLPSLQLSVEVAANQFGADGDLSHWEIGGLYIGSGMQGSSVLTYTLGDVRLDVTIV